MTDSARPILLAIVTDNAIGYAMRGFVSLVDNSFYPKKHKR